MNCTALYVKLQVPSLEKYEMIMAELNEAGFEGSLRLRQVLSGMLLLI